MIGELSIINEWIPEQMEPGTVFVLENAGEVGEKEDPYWAGACGRPLPASSRANKWRACRPPSAVPRNARRNSSLRTESSRPENRFRSRFHRSTGDAACRGAHNLKTAPFKQAHHFLSLQSGKAAHIDIEIVEQIPVRLAAREVR